MEYIGEGQWRCKEHEKVGFVDDLTPEERHLQNICEDIARMRMALEKK